MEQVETLEREVAVYADGKMVGYMTLSNGLYARDWFHHAALLAERRGFLESWAMYKFELAWIDFTDGKVELRSMVRRTNFRRRAEVD